MKVTLPAAMDYTGTHSQAEYDTALEERSEALVGRDKASGTYGPTRTSQCDNQATSCQELVGGWKGAK